LNYSSQLFVFSIIILVFFNDIIFGILFDFGTVIYIEAQSAENTSVVTSIPTSPSSYTNVPTAQGNVNNSDGVVNCVSTTPSSLSSTTSPVQVDSNTALSSLKTIAQKAIDQAGIDISQQSTDNKSNYKIVFFKLLFKVDI